MVMINKQVTPINTGGTRFAPTPSFNQSPKAILPPRADMPKIKGDAIDIDFSSLARYASRVDQQEAVARQKELFDDYALRLDEVVEGQRQGVYSYQKAESMIRSLTDEAISRGASASDIAKLRDKYDGGLYSLAESQQKVLAEHETKRQTQMFDDFRSQYNFAKNWSDNKVSFYIDRANQLQTSLDYFSGRLSDEEISDEDRRALEAAQDDTFQTLGGLNMYLSMQEMLNTDYKGMQMSQDLLNTMKTRMVNKAVESGMGYRQALMNADTIIQASDANTLMQDKFKDMVNSTEAMKKMIDYTDAGIQSQIRTYPEAAILYNIPKEVIPYLQKSEQDLIANSVRKIYNYNPKDKDFYLFGKTVSSYTKPEVEFNYKVLQANNVDTGYPLSLLSRQAAVAAESSLAYAGDINTLSSPDQVAEEIANIDKAYAILDDPALVRRMDQAEPDIKSAFDSSKMALVGKKAHAQLLLNDPEAVANIKTLTNSLQRDRIRYIPDTGEVVLTEDTGGFWTLANLANIFSSGETAKELDRLNKDLQALPPDARVAAVESISGGSIQPLAAGETAWKPGVYSKATGAAINLPSKLLQSLDKSDTGRSIKQAITMPGISLSKPEPTTAETLRSQADALERSTNNLSPEGLKEYGEGNRRAIKAARDLADKLEVETTVRSSTPLANAFVVTDSNEDNADVANSSRSYIAGLKLERRAIALARKYLKGSITPEEEDELKQLNEELVKYDIDPVDPYNE